jgi:lipoprotein-anchoring transpeptidase ErfK/SrfK
VLVPDPTTRALARRYRFYIAVSRRERRLRLFEHLKLARTYVIAVGRIGLETPGGLYRIDDKQVNPSWHVPRSAWADALAGRVIPPGPDDPLKPRWMGFTAGPASTAPTISPRSAPPPRTAVSVCRYRT